MNIMVYGIYLNYRPQALRKFSTKRRTGCLKGAEGERPYIINPETPKPSTFGA